MAGDVDVGDVIVLPGTEDAVLVSRVRLAQGGLIFTVTAASGDPPQTRPGSGPLEARDGWTGALNHARSGRKTSISRTDPGVTVRTAGITAIIAVI